VTLARAIEALHLTMSYAIAKMLNSEGIRTRHGKLFDTTRIERILKRLNYDPTFEISRPKANEKKPVV
jgi:hypothetical protein